MALTTRYEDVAKWFVAARDAANIQALPRSVGKSVALGMAYGMGIDFHKYAEPKSQSTYQNGTEAVAHQTSIPVYGARRDRWNQIVGWCRDYDMVAAVHYCLPWYTRLNLEHQGAPVTSHKRLVRIGVFAHDGHNLAFTDPGEDFPSVELHAKLALTVASGGVRRRVSAYEGLTHQMDAYMYAMQAVKNRNSVMDPNARAV